MHSMQTIIFNMKAQVERLKGTFFHRGIYKEESSLYRTFQTDFKNILKTYNGYLTACRKYDSKLKNDGSPMSVFNPSRNLKAVAINDPVVWSEVVEVVDTVMGEMWQHCPCNVNSCPAVNVYSCSCHNQWGCDAHKNNCCNNQLGCGNHAKCGCNSQTLRCVAYACTAHACNCNCDGHW